MRVVLADYLKQLVADTPSLASINVIPDTRALPELSSPTLIVKTDTYTPEPVAPLSKRRGNFTLTLATKHKDIARAEDELDALLEVLLPALLTSGVVWTEATQVEYASSVLAYDIKVTSVLTPEPTPEPVPDEGE